MLFSFIFQTAKRVICFVQKYYRGPTVVAERGLGKIKRRKLLQLSGEGETRER